MPIPTRTVTFNNFVSSTAEHRRKDLVDNFFGSAPLFVRLRKRNQIPVKGGNIIEVKHVYGGFTAGSYGRGTEFDTATKEFATTLVFNWKFNYAAVNLDVIDVDLNDSPEQVFDLVDAAMETAELSLVDELADQLYGDGTGNGNQDLDGLAIAVSRTGTYGGLARGTDAQGASIRAAFEDATGGTTTLNFMNTNFGTATVAREKPDLIVCPQTLWNAVWARSQGSERNSGGEDLREIGMDTIRFNGASIVVDSHCPAGFMYFLNTKFFELFTQRKWDFRFRGFMEPTNQQRQIGQLLYWGNIVNRAPRLNGVLTGLTA